jgi:RHS repeat-associated protein
MKCLLGCLTVILILVTSHAVHAQCGNNASHGPDSDPTKSCDQPPSGDPFNPYTGNEHREMHDLQIWGGTGEIPMMWKRYYNSREFTGWTYSFQYKMADAGPNSSGQPLLTIALPEGGLLTFTQVAPATWLPFPGVQEQLFQQGNNYFLQMPNGHRYRFAKITNSSGSFYQLQDIKDGYQNQYILAYTSNGLLQRFTEPAGRYFQLTYDSLNGHSYLRNVTTSDGRSVQYNYTPYTESGITWILLTSVQYGDGTTATYAYHQPHYSGLGFVYLEHAIDPRYSGPNVNMKFTYNNLVAHGFIKEEINGKTGEVMATLNGDWMNRWVCYANGRVQHIVMPSELLGKTTQYSDGLGRTSNYAYDANGFINQVTDAKSQVTSFIKTIYGKPLQTTHPDGFAESWTRDDLGLELSHTDKLGHTTTYTRDALHRTTTITHPDGTTEHFSYNSFGQVTAHTGRNGGVTVNTYNSRGLKTSTTDALGKVTSYIYDVADRLARITDALGNTTMFEYNERGLMTKKINPDNSFQLYTYDDYGNRTSTTNETGGTWTAVFDEFKRMTSQTDPLNRTTLYSYDLPGGACGCGHDRNTPTQITLPGGKTTKIEYDMEWQKIKETAGAGTLEEATTFYEYDVLGNLVRITDPKLKSWTYEYDVMNRRTSETDPLGNRIERTYDKEGNVLTDKRPDNGVTTYQYDVMDRLVQTTDPKGQVTKMVYDSEGNVTRLTDANNQHYDYQYDLLNRRTKSIYPGGSFESYLFDAVGNMVFYTNRAGNTNTISYDNRNRETSSVWSDGTPAVARTYDAAGRLLSLSSSVSAITYTYNQASELTSETQNVAGAGGAKQISYTYNSDGLRSNMAYPGAGLVTGYEYTARNQLGGISANGQNLVAYGYDLNGNRVAAFRSNGTGTSSAYDDANRVLSITHQLGGVAFAHYDYGYDNMGRRKYVRRNYDKGDVYAYDATDQVTNVQYDVTNPHNTPGTALRTVNYSYDAAGNRTHLSDNGVITNYISNDKNQYTSVGSNLFTYNANGDLVTQQGWTYTYDAKGRLTAASNGSVTASMAYDGRNRCVSRTINGNTIYLYYDDWNLIEEYNTSGLLNQYIHGAVVDEIVVKRSNGISVFYHHDAIGNTTQLTDINGSLAEQYAYDIFGKVVMKDGSGMIITASSFGNRFLFTGRELIQELELYDYRNRMYSFALGRFLQVDPIGFGGHDLNLYRYVENDPLNRLDPYGTFWGAAGRAILGGVVSGIVGGLIRGAGGILKSILDFIDKDRQREHDRKLMENAQRYCSAKQTCKEICDPKAVKSSTPATYKVALSTGTVEIPCGETCVCCSN